MVAASLAILEQMGADVFALAGAIAYARTGESAAWANHPPELLAAASATVLRCAWIWLIGSLARMQFVRWGSRAGEGPAFPKFT
jgi:hypothetical protein